MRYRKIPPNIGLFRPTMFGFEYRSLLLIISLSLITIFVLKINTFLSALLGLVTAFTAIMELTGRTFIMRKLSRVRFRRYGARYFPQYRISREDKDPEGIFRISGKLYFIARIKPRMLPEARESEQRNVLNGIRRLISSVEVDAEFFAYTGIAELDGGEQRVYALFSLPPDSLKKSAGFLSENSLQFLEGLRALDYTYTIPQCSELGDLFDSIFHSDKSDSENKQKSLRLRRNFISGDNNFIIIGLKDSDYDSGPLLYAYLEGSGIATATRFTLHRIRDEHALRLLKSARADRKAQLRISGEHMREHGTGVSTQIEAINHMEENLKGDRDPLITVSLTLSLMGKHPVHLTEYESTYRRSLNYLGLNFRIVPPSRSSIASIFPSGGPLNGNYLMNASAASTIIPVSFSSSDRNGVEIGIDDLNGRTVFLPIVYGAANNFMVVGETGSGKSFFTRTFVRRMIRDALIDCLYVYDPLEEYDFSDIEKNANLEIRVFRKKMDQSASFAHDTMKQLYGLMESDLRRKAIIIEEGHTVIFDDEARKFLERMVRHSRHYNTIIFNITQNVDDMTRYANSSLALNSSHIFIFRTRKISEKDLVALKIDGFTSVEPQNLLGGKGYPYSECYYSDGKYCRRIRIFSEVEFRPS